MIQQNWSLRVETEAAGREQVFTYGLFRHVGRNEGKRREAANCWP